MRILCALVFVLFTGNVLSKDEGPLNTLITAVPAPADCIDHRRDRPCRPSRNSSRTAYPTGYDCTCPTLGRAGIGAVVGANGTPSPPNTNLPMFQDYVLAAGFDTPISFEFTDNTNEMFVGSQKGMIYHVDLATGASKLYLDLSLEAAFGADRGLMDVKTSPNFDTTRQIFLTITVDPDQTDGLEPFTEAPANQRLIRYMDLGGGVVDANSRTVFFGAGAWDGVPSCFSSHSIGTLMFGWDGSLMLTTGDASRWDFQAIGDWGQNSQYSMNPRTNQVIPSLDIACSNFGNQDVGAFRSQIMYSLGGKILRLDPNTGDGICADATNGGKYPTKNPWCDTSKGKSIPSKLWALGLRNPFRATVRPFQAGKDNANFPGVIYFGDVGQTGYEEINAVTRAGMNFGWPCWEGPFPTPTYRDSPYNNDNGPTLTGLTGCPGDADGCEQIVEIAKFPDGSRITCDAIYSKVTTDLPFFYYSRVANYDMEGNYGDASYTGMGYQGASTAGVAFYQGNAYPEAYQGALFILDYSW